MKTVQSKNRTSSTLAALAFLLAFLSSNAFASVVEYRQVFGNSAGTNQGIQTATNWFAHRGGAADSINATTGIFISGNTGTPTDLGNVNSDASTSQTNGFLAMTGTTTFALAWTDEHTINRSLNEIAEMSFYSWNNGISSSHQVALKIGTDWFVSTTEFKTNPSINDVANAVKNTLSFSTDASDWRALSFTPGTTLGLGSVLSSDLPSGNVTGFGLYMNTTFDASVLRADTFEIQVIPEPGSLILVGIGMGLFVVTLRRRKKA